MNILMTDDKKLLCTGKRRPIYKFETQADKFKFLIPQFLDDIDLSSTLCVVECLLPNKTGLYKLCTYEEELYKDMLTFSVPITSTITKCVGDEDSADVFLYLMFLKPNEENSAYADAVIKTNGGVITVLNNHSIDAESEETFDEIWEHSSMDDINRKLDELEETKSDGITLTENGVIELKSGDTTIASFTLPDDVVWEEWN